jgi:ParB-like chromosome segregation protein Spo0J
MVNDIAKKTKNKKKFTPLIVSKEGKKYRIIDGHHRYDAYKKLGKEKIKCIVIPEKNVTFKNLTKKMEKELLKIEKGPK